MIVKQVPNPRKSSSKQGRIAGLAEYIRETVSGQVRDKCVFAGAENFISPDPDAQVLEMIGLAMDNVRSKDPIKHYVLSWPADEHPTPQHAAQAAAMFIDTLGLAGHQYIFGLHQDTDNSHLHIVANRIHPLTGRAVEINKGFDIEVAHQALARIEHAQGWRPEKNGRYLMTEQGHLVLRETGRVVPAKPRRRDHQVVSETGEVTIVRADLSPRPRQPSQRARDIEAQTGERSAERIAIEQAGPIIRAVTTWSDLHDKLGKLGMRYEKFGSGAQIYVGDVALKASTVDRQAAFKTMERRLGPYEPPPTPAVPAAAVPAPAPQPLRPALTEYVLAKHAHDEARKTRRDQLIARQRRDKAKLAAQQSAKRNSVLQRNWRGNSYELNAMRMVVAAEQKAAVTDLATRHRAERKSQLGAPFIRLKDWMVQNGPGIMIAAARAYRAGLTMMRLQISIVSSPADLRASITSNRLATIRSLYVRPLAGHALFAAASRPASSVSALASARLRGLPRRQLVPDPFAVEPTRSGDPQLLVRSDAPGRLHREASHEGVRLENQPTSRVRGQAEKVTPPAPSPSPPARPTEATPPVPFPVTPAPGLSPAQIAAIRSRGHGR